MIKAANMKKTLFLLLACISLNAQEGYDETSFYAKILGGANFVNNTSIDGNKATYEAGYIVGASIGYNFRHNLSLEAEYAYRRNNLSKIHFVNAERSHNGHLQTSSLMANILWKTPCPFFCFQPFFGAGIGYDFQQMRSSNSQIRFHQNWSRFSWQLMAGLAYSIFCNTDLTLEYKYHQAGCKFYNHTVALGLIYNFDLR